MLEGWSLGKLWAIAKPVHSFGAWCANLFKLQSRVTELERRAAEAATAQRPSPHRKCPQCGERDFRLRDKYRARPDVFGPRFLHEKWLCYSCGHEETRDIQEPD